MEIKKIRVEHFQCPVCKTVYKLEETARKCAANFEMIQKNKDISPYIWVRLKQHNKLMDDKFIDVFINKCVVEYKYSNSDNKCLNIWIALYDAECRQYFTTENWSIHETFTIEEYYEQTGKYPKAHEKYSEDISNRIEIIKNVEKDKLLDRWNSKDKYELIEELKTHNVLWK